MNESNEDINKNQKKNNNSSAPKSIAKPANNTAKKQVTKPVNNTSKKQATKPVNNTPKKQATKPANKPVSKQDNKQVQSSPSKKRQNTSTKQGHSNTSKKVEKSAQKEAPTVKNLKKRNNIDSQSKKTSSTKSGSNNSKSAQADNVREFRKLPEKKKIQGSSSPNKEKMKVDTKVIKTYEPKKSFTERIEDKLGFEIIINWITVLKFVIIAAIVIGGISYALYATRLTDVEVHAGEHYSEEEIKDFVIRGGFDKNAVILFLKNRYSKMDDIPFVEYIDVELVNKNKVRLTVYEKKIIGCTEYMNQYIYFDKDGVFVEASTDVYEGTAYITGIDFKDITLYEKMNVDDDGLFDTIISLTQQITQYGLNISEINFDKDSNVTLYSSNVTVKLGKHDTYDEQLALIKNMLLEAEQNSMKGVLHLENFVEGQKNFIFDKTE